MALVRLAEFSSSISTNSPNFLAMTETRVQKELQSEEESRLKAGGEALHGTSASSFIMIGLDIEDVQ